MFDGPLRGEVDYLRALVSSESIYIWCTNMEGKAFEVDAYTEEVSWMAALYACVFGAPKDYIYSGSPAYSMGFQVIGDIAHEQLTVKIKAATEV